MGKVFLHARSTSKEKTDPYATLTVYCPSYTTIRAESVNTTIAFEKVSYNGEVIFERMTEGEWEITFAGVEHAPVRRVIIGSLDYEMTLSYFEAPVTITYPAGSTCVVTDGKNTLVAPDTSGKWVCTIPNTGTWTITSTYGDKTASTQVVITRDGQTESVELDYFEATINVTYPVGSTCTASNGSTTLLAPDITGVWTCIVSLAGTWTFKCVDGAKSFSVDVDITTDDGIYNVYLNYPVVVYSTLEDMLSDNPPDYTTAIISNTGVSGWVFTDVSSPAPDNPIAGLVWIEMSDGIPVGARHYISDVWVDVPMYNRYGGEWHNPVAQHLYRSGDEYTDVTGGFSSVNILKSSSSSRLTVDTVQKNTGNIYLKASSNCQASIATTNKIDITNCSYLTMIVNDCSLQSSTINGGNKLMLTTSRLDASTAVASATIQDGITTILLDGLSGTYYVVAAIHGVSGTNYAYIDEIYLT